MASECRGQAAVRATCRFALMDLAAIHRVERRAQGRRNGADCGRAPRGVPHREFEGLHEHDRSNVEFLPSEDFDLAVASFFQSPDELVLGRETALQAKERFSAAIQTVMADPADGDIVIVSHGTVMALYVARWAGVEAVAFWRRLGLPSFVVLSLPDHEMVSLVESV